MKKIIMAAACVLMAAACGNKEPVDVFIPKGKMELVGNGFDLFSLGGDIRLYMSPAEDNADMWVVQAVAPIRKEAEAKLAGITMQMTLLDEQNVRVRDSFVLEAEEIENLLPVFNGSVPGMEKNVVFSVPDGGAKKLFTFKQAKSMLETAKNISLAINAEQEVAVQEEAAPEDKPYTLKWLCNRKGIYGLLSQYEKAVRGGDKRKANELEKRIYAIEKEVKNDSSLPESLKKSFLSYVDKRVDEIDSRY